MVNFHFFRFLAKIGHNLWTIYQFNYELQVKKSKKNEKFQSLPNITFYGLK